MTKALADTVVDATAALTDNAQRYFSLEERMALRNARMVRASGRAPNPDDTTEQAQALSLGVRLAPKVGGTVNALAVALADDVSWPALIADMEFLLPTLGANTGAVTVDLDGFTVPPGRLKLLTRGGADLKAGDLDGSKIKARADGAGALRLVSLTKAEIGAAAGASTEVQQSFNTFILNKPPTLIRYVDATNGNDANDGSTPALAYKTIDRPISLTQNYTLILYLMTDVTWSNRLNIYNSMFIQGVTITSGAISAFTNRGITFLGEAANSPVQQGRCTAGAFLYGASLTMDHAYVVLPDAVAGVTVTDHIQVQQGGTVSLSVSTVTTVSTNGTSALIGSPSNQGGGYFTSCNFSARAYGRLFAGVASGANPNSLWNFRSNLTSA